MNILKKESGEFSHMNVFNLIVFLLGVIEIVRPLVPPEYIVYVGVGVAVINLYLRTFKSSGETIQGIAQG